MNAERQGLYPCPGLIYGEVLFQYLVALKVFFPFASMLNYFLFHLSKNIQFLLASFTIRRLSGS
jgi:hypothetical protein